MFEGSSWCCLWWLESPSHGCGLVLFCCLPIYCALMRSQPVAGIRYGCARMRWAGSKCTVFHSIWVLGQKPLRLILPPASKPLCLQTLSVQLFKSNTFHAFPWGGVIHKPFQSVSQSVVQIKHFSCINWPPCVCPWGVEERC